MTTSSEAEMSASAVDAFLGRHETGVLSLARDDSPYAIPVSYGYDETEREAFLRLVSAADSEKRAFLASEPEARLVVHDETDRVYTSAIAVGTLERVDPETLTAETIARYGETRRPCTPDSPLAGSSRASRRSPRSPVDSSDTRTRRWSR
jgi:hypothetical protein